MKRIIEGLSVIYALSVAQVVSAETCTTGSECESGLCDNGQCAVTINVTLLRGLGTFVDCATGACFGPLTVQDLNDRTGLDCPGCENGVYTVQNSTDIWAILYGGLHHDGTVDCDSDVRRTLVGDGHPDAGYETSNSETQVSFWENLFVQDENTCVDEPCGSDFHLWRRGDADDVTSMLMELTGIRTFCNGTQYEDNDPIRRPCYGNGAFAEDVCGPDGTAGLVLPVVLPTQYEVNHNSCSKGVFKWLNAVFKLRPKCDDGSNSVFGMCLIPVDGAGNAGCVNPPGNPSMFTPSQTDTRAFNRILRRLNGSVAIDDTGMDVTNAYFRMHEIHTASLGAETCRQTSVDTQVDCLIQASGCTTGYTARNESHLPGVQEVGLYSGVIVIPHFNICPTIDYLNAAPIVIGVGGHSNLTATVSDLDGDLLTHTWNATSGTVADPSALATVYTCAQVGNHTVTFNVEDPDRCVVSKTIPIICR
jgi:hypothetical protein